jgi:murein L,D-transpeptidase YafK
VVRYAPDKYQVIKTFHTTVGKVKGDKEEEGDLKTPEGVYTFKARLTPPSLKPKFGAMAFYINYPNPFDEMAGRTGFDIMLHSTNEPDRLKQDFDSQGCVVVNNDEIKDLASYIRLTLTPILIFADLTPDYMKPSADPKLEVFFRDWIRNWEARDVESYITHYHSGFKSGAMNKTAWKAYKSNLNTRYADISIGPENVQYYRHPKYSVVMFIQNYRSKLKRGAWGFRSRGTKILYVAEEDGHPKIVAENFTQLVREAP